MHLSIKESWLSSNNREGCLYWGLPNFAFALTSSDAELINTAKTVFAPWVRGPTTSTICHWRVERCRCDRESDASQTQEQWVVRTNSCQNSSVHASPDVALLNVEFNAVQKCAESRKLLGLHAALLSKNDRGIVIVGPSESGKSTLACALWQQGWSFLCDDYALIDSACCSAFPTPRRVSLRPTSRELLGERLWAQILAVPSCVRTQKSFAFHPSDVDGRPPTTTTRLQAVIFLARQGQETAPGEIRRVEPAHALLSLLPQSNLYTHFDQGEAIRRAVPLANSVPAFDLGRGPLGRMTERIENLVDP